MRKIKLKINKLYYITLKNKTKYITKIVSKTKIKIIKCIIESHTGVQNFDKPGTIYSQEHLSWSRFESVKPVPKLIAILYKRKRK